MHHVDPPGWNGAVLLRAPHVWRRRRRRTAMANPQQRPASVWEAQGRRLGFRKTVWGRQHAGAFTPTLRKLDAAGARLRFPSENADALSRWSASRDQADGCATTARHRSAGDWQLDTDSRRTDGAHSRIQRTDGRIPRVLSRVA